MTKENIVIGIRVSYDRTDRKLYLSLEDPQNILEADVIKSKLTFNVPREAQYQALFSGTIKLELENYPCYIMEDAALKVNRVIETMAEPINNQQTLFNQNSEESNVKRQAFVPAEYEAHRLAGTKYRPDPSLSKKQTKKWHNERRAYEAKMGYPSMYPSEKKGGNAATDEKPAQQPSNVPEEQVKNVVDKDAELIASAMGVDSKDVEIVKSDVGTKVQPEPEKPIDIAREYEANVFDIGDGNEFATFGANWDGFVIAYHHKKDNLYTIAATPPHPENGCRYYLTFPTDRGAKFVRDLMLKHGDLNEAVKDSQIYKISDILVEELKPTPCVIIKQGLPYLNSIKV